MQVFVHNRNEFIDSQISKQDRTNGMEWNGSVAMNQNGVFHSIPFMCFCMEIGKSIRFESVMENFSDFNTLCTVGNIQSFMFRMKMINKTCFDKTSNLCFWMDVMNSYNQYHLLIYIIYGEISINFCAIHYSTLVELCTN